MSHSQFHCTGRVYLDMHGLIFETSICYWQDQPGSPGSCANRTGALSRKREGGEPGVSGDGFCSRLSLFGGALCPTRAASARASAAGGARESVARV